MNSSYNVVAQFVNAELVNIGGQFQYGLGDTFWLLNIAMENGETICSNVFWFTLPI